MPIKSNILLFTKYFGLIFIVGFSSYLGFSLLGFDVPKFRSAFGGIFFFSIATSITLTVDILRKRTSNRHPSIMQTFLIEYQATLLFLILILLYSMVFALTHFLTQSSFKTITTPYLSLNVGGTREYYFPISSHESWQNTYIQLKKGQRFDVYVSGRVSPGQLQNAKYIINALDNWIKAGRPVPPSRDFLTNLRPERIPWLFTGPEGYPDQFYNEKIKNIEDLKLVTHYNRDNGLTVKGRPHNAVIGIIMDEGQTLTGRKFDWKSGDSENLLLNFSAKEKEYPLHFSARRTGILWVVINDSEEFRIDNMGQFFLKLIILG